MFPDFKKFTLLRQQETIASSKTIAMSEAEKKWEDFDDNNRYHIDFPKTKPEVSRDSREAYKSQLKKLIEERIMGMYKKDKRSQIFARTFGSLTMKQIFKLIDQVKPPQP